MLSLNRRVPMRCALRPMMDWNESSIFQSVKKRNVHDVCTERSKEI
jgi:hypothetical protein